VLALPESLRSAFKEPFGSVYTDPEQLLSVIEKTATEQPLENPPLIAVGDVVSYHIVTTGRQPDVMVIDGKTEREAVDSEIETQLSDPTGTIQKVSNPPGELSEELLVTLREAIEADEPVTICVDGEEDLATLPAIVAAPLGGSVVYGQPGEGMVHVAVTADQTETARTLLGRFDGETTAAFELLTGDHQ